MPDLDRRQPVPERRPARRVRRRRSAGRARRPNGWYTDRAADHDHRHATRPDGSGVEQIQYRINGGTPQLYTGAVRPRRPRASSRSSTASIDRAGNAETLQGDRAQGRRHGADDARRRRSRAGPARAAGAIRRSRSACAPRTALARAGRARRIFTGSTRPATGRRGRRTRARSRSGAAGDAGRRVPLAATWRAARKPFKRARHPRRHGRADHDTGDERCRAGVRLHGVGAGGLHAHRRCGPFGRGGDGSTASSGGAWTAYEGSFDLAAVAGLHARLPLARSRRQRRGLQARGGADGPGADGARWRRPPAREAPSTIAPRPFAALQEVASRLRDDGRAARRALCGRRELPGRLRAAR